MPGPCVSQAQQPLPAAAAREGLTVWDSPFLRAEAMPAHTGEPFREWNAKVRAWEEGWNQAVAARAEAQGAIKTAWIHALHQKCRQTPRSRLDLFCAAGSAEPGHNASVVTGAGSSLQGAARSR